MINKKRYFQLNNYIRMKNEPEKRAGGALW